MEEPKFKKRACAICNSTESRVLYEQSFAKISKGGSLLSGYDLVVCTRCGFCFADKIPEQAVFDAYYREMSKYEKTEYGEQDSPYDQARFQVLADIILKIIPSQHERIFEIGCANGQLLALLKKQGHENVSGIDPSPVSAKIAQQRYGINVSANTLSDVSKENELVDFLILSGVLEHIRDLHVALQQLRELLPMEKYILIAVPDASRHTAGEDAPYQELSVEHINFFGPQSLTNLLSANGFELVFLKQGLVQTNYRTTTNVIFGLYKKSDLPMAIVPDQQTEKGLVAYLEKSRQAENRIRQIISKIASGKLRIVVWGAGAHALHLLSVTRLKEANIQAFVDLNPKYQGKELIGIPIIAPQDLDEDSGAILISSRIYQNEIEKQIREDLRLENQIITLYSMK